MQDPDLSGRIPPFRRPAGIAGGRGVGRAMAFGQLSLRLGAQMRA